MRIISLGIPYRALALIMEPLLNEIGEPGVALRNILTAFFTMLVGITVGIQWGLTGLCIGWVIAGVVATTVNLTRSLPLLGMTYRELMSIIFPSIVGAGIMHVAVLAAINGPLAGISPVARMSLATSLGVIVYGSFILIFNQATLIRAIKILRHAI